jgi:hypothetical protein
MLSNDKLWEAWRSGESLGATACLRAVADAAVSHAVFHELVGYQYLYQHNGSAVWREEPSGWNGQQPTDKRALYASQQPASCSPKTQSADTSRSHVVESGNSEHVSVSGRVSVRDEPTPEVMAAAAIAVLNDVSPGDMELANQAALIVLKKVNAPHGLSLSAIATSIATMAPAYRAMIKAGQE